MLWTRISAEQTIRDTYPPDSRDPERARVGIDLRDQAAQIVLGRDLSPSSAEPRKWMFLSNSLLYCFAQLCLDREAADHVKIRELAGIS